MKDIILKRIAQDVKKYLKKNHFSHNWDHTLRVYNLAIKIGKKEKADLEVLKYASLLHDIAREKEDKTKGKVKHEIEGAKIAEKILKRYNINKDKLKNIIHCIETHRFRSLKKPKTKEAKVLFDADKLDSIGAIGIGRAFLFAGRFNARLHNSDIDIKKTKPYTQEDTAYREYIVKLKKIGKKLFTKEGKKIARGRDLFMKEFFRRLDKEIKGYL